MWLGCLRASIEIFDFLSNILVNGSVVSSKHEVPVDLWFYIACRAVVVAFTACMKLVQENPPFLIARNHI